MRDDNFLKENNARHMWHPMAHPADSLKNAPTIVTGAKGVRITDIDGKETIDAVGGLWNVNLGYSAHVILPSQGVEEWDRPGSVAHDPEALAEFCDEMRKVMIDPIQFSALDSHINDQEFADEALRIFDAWIADGTIKT